MQHTHDPRPTVPEAGLQGEPEPPDDRKLDPNRRPGRSIPAPADPRPTGRLQESGLPYLVRPAPQLSVRFDAELSTWLHLAAQARAGSPQALAAELLARGLQHEARRARAHDLLQLLTPRERQVTELTARGQTNRQIAHALRISPETVKSHVRNTLSKFGLHSKGELRLLLQEAGAWED